MKPNRMFAFCGLSLSLVFLTVPLFATEPPTCEFLSAALSSQLEAGSIDLVYDYSHDGKLAGVTHCRYVRSPRIQYFAQGDERVPSFAWFDKISGTFRLLSNDKGILSALVSDSKSNSILSRASVPDPILYNFAAGDLLSVMNTGTVNKNMEVVDGHDCWRVDIVVNDKPAAGDRYAIWLDPDLGFSARRIEAHWPNDIACITTKLYDYSKVDERVWIPMTMKWVISHPGEADSTSTVVIKNAKIVPELTVSDLDTSFPSGTEVNDKILDAEYVIP